MEPLKRYFLTNGQFMITNVPAQIYTVLGSCVSVCLWDKQRMLSGINHYRMPGSPESTPADPDQGYASVNMLIRSMRNRGASIGSMEAKVFGGCNSWVGDHTLFSVGRRNIEVAVALMEEAGIRIVAQHTGGNYGRKIIFNTQTGKVRMFILNRSAAEVNEVISRGFGY